MAVTLGIPTKSRRAPWPVELGQPTPELAPEQLMEAGHGQVSTTGSKLLTVTCGKNSLAWVQGCKPEVPPVPIT